MLLSNAFSAILGEDELAVRAIEAPLVAVRGNKRSGVINADEEEGVDGVAPARARSRAKPIGDATKRLMHPAAGRPCLRSRNR
ncbi:MAG: hypothetical protein U1E76_15440 [Planctomycetota bacterium]